MFPVWSAISTFSMLHSPASPRFVRRGRASRTKKDLDDGGQSGSDEIASDVDNVDELRDWLSLQSFSSRGMLPNEQLVRKFLPPGTISDLYGHYRATQTMLGCHSVSYLTWHPLPCFYLFFEGYLNLLISLLVFLQTKNSLDYIDTFKIYLYT